MTARTINIASRRFNFNQGLVVHGKFQVLLRAIRIAGCAGMALAVLSGCMSQAVNRMEDQILARRAETLQGWEDVTLDGQPILESLWYRAAMVWLDFDSVSAGMDESGPWFQGKGEDFRGIATAAAISQDGYLLTAGHVVEDVEKLDVTLFYRKDGGGAAVAAVRARVVWESEDDFDRDWNSDPPQLPLDLAILHVDVPRLAPFRLADELPSVNAPVISTGFGSQLRKMGWNEKQLASGRVLAVYEQESRGSSPAWVAVLHDTPLMGGDSGGPMLDRNGNLLGINYRREMDIARWQFLAIWFGLSPTDFGELEFFSLAYMPDRNWLRQVIEKDRLQKNAGSTTSTPQEPGGLH